MTDEQLLSHCLNALTGEYGEIAQTILVEQLQRRLYRQNPEDSLPALSPVEIRRLANRPWSAVND